MACPACTGNPGLHLGVTINGTHCYCWRCGWKPVDYILSKLLGCSIKEAKDIAAQYGGRVSTKEPTMVVRKKAFKYPSGITQLTTHHKKYLAQRGFDPATLEKEWGLMSCGPTSELVGLCYRFRILAPILWSGVPVSFQARDVTNKSDLKYKACPKDREVIHHKDVLYCHPNIEWGKVVFVVEGITDVWKLGRQSVATFGIEYKRSQVRWIAKLKKQTDDRRVVIMFDDDPQAVVQAEKLRSELLFLGLECCVYQIDGDPGGMSSIEARTLARDLQMWYGM